MRTPERQRLQALPPGAVGRLVIPLGWRGYWRVLSFVGGPYEAYPGAEAAFGVCVRSEDVLGLQMNAHLPIPDYGVPKSEEIVLHVLHTTLTKAFEGRDIYVGCKAGWGRTGLFLALVAKAVGEANPLAFVRQNYSPRAIETDEQADYLATFDTRTLSRSFYRRIWWPGLRQL